MKKEIKLFDKVILRNKSRKIVVNAICSPVENLAIISCSEHWFDEEEEGDEYSDAAYYLDSNEIDQVIEALKKAKEFIKP